MSDMNVGILIIGNEILDGVVLDTNSNWLAKRIKTLGFYVKEFMTVRDDVGEISKAIHRMMMDGCNLIITSGGLGPTHDDKTLSGVAEAFNLNLKLNDEALRIVRRQYKAFYDRGLIESPEITEARRKMAFIPEGGEPLDNRVGGAPGVWLKTDKATVVCLPGVPRELRWMFENVVLERLREMVQGVFEETFVVLPVRDESSIAPMIDMVMNRVPGVYVKSMPGEYGALRGLKFWISARGVNAEEARSRVAEAMRLLRELVQAES